ncbi:MAG: hypothetical protein IT260_17290 [Saprospiraceae bacterium]|nr:hypothetical protein [Saprospiraceae bacterium]
MKVFFTLFLSLIALFTTAQNSDCTLDLGPDITVCNNARFSLNPHPQANDGQYTWTGSIGLSCYNCPSPEVSGLSTGTYTFIATVTTPDCMDSDTVRVFVINGEAPAYTITESMGICAGDSVSIGGPAISGTFYNWFSVPPGFASSLANPKVKPSGPVTYYLSTSTLTCPLLSLDSVRITPVALSLQLTPTDTVRLCLGKSRTLQATVSPAGQTISWSPGAGLQISGNGATAVATPLESTMYTATASLAGCTRQQRVYLALDSLPKELDIQPADTSICLGETVILESGTYDPDEYLGISSKWTPLNGLLYSDTLFNNVVQPSQTTLFRRITRKGLCIDTSFALVKVIPTAQMITSPVDTFICPGNTVLLSLSFVTPGVTNIEWSPANGLSCTQCTSTFATPVNTQTYSVSGEYQGCPVNASATVHLKPLPPLHFPDDRQLCAGESVQLNDQFDLMSTYVWTSTHPGFGTVTKADPSFMPTQTATYTVVANNGCIRKDSVTIVLNKAILTVKGDTTICKNFTATLSASATLPEISYVWIDKNTGQTVGTGQTIQVKPDVTTTYAVLYTYGDNCQLTDDVTVTINGEAPVLVIPTDVRICPDETVTLNSGPVLAGTVYNWVASPPDPTLAPTSATPVVSPDQTTMYSVVATLGNCSVAQQIKITADNATLTVTPDTTVCDSTLTTLRAMGSAPDGSYAWSTGAQSSTINVMPAGNTT